MVSRMKTWADFARHHEVCKERLRLARQGDEEALDQIRDEIDSIILREHDGKPFLASTTCILRRRSAGQGEGDGEHEKASQHLPTCSPSC